MIKIKREHWYVFIHKCMSSKVNIRKTFVNKQKRHLKASAVFKYLKTLTIKNNAHAIHMLSHLQCKDDNDPC